MGDIILRRAAQSDLAIIWEIIQGAILRRKAEGSTQWQDGYPNLDTILADIKNEVGFVAVQNEQIVAYVVINPAIDPEYKEIDGKWLSSGPALVIHRVAVAEEFLGRGVATKIFKEVEEMAKKSKIESIKVDTNFDNTGMLKILEKLNYIYCGQVYFRGSARKAFEKLIN